MEWQAATLLLLGGVVALMLLGIPVALAFLGINLVGAWLFLGGEPGLMQLVRNSVASVSSFALTPIPLFVLMGEVLFHTGLALKAIDAVDRLIRRVPGRLAVVAIVAGTIFSAISGSTIATTALLGSLMLPEMLKRGYEPGFAMGPIMGIGGVDMLIPPSALAVLLGSLAGISIAQLLVAGTVPGLIMSAMFIGYIVLRAALRPDLAPPDSAAPRSADPSGFARWRPLLVHVLPLVLIFGAVVASMTRGWATPTESAAVGAAATIAVAAIQRSLTVAALRKALMGT
ncbi:MAG: TRAP transporter large permease subunit, partial [Alphaproteobacteria bacterium]|nr:TRAP transporter large permease subunit [Alphaproteobacteria bacterium]